MSKKKEKMPQYVSSELNTPMLNYRVYKMSKKESLLTILASYIVGGSVGLVFYGGQFLTEEGLSTHATKVWNIVLFLIIGAIVSAVFYPIRQKQLKVKRKQKLTNQFRSFLDSLAVSLSSGMNMSEALNSTLNDLKGEYSEDAYIVKETEELLNGINNNIPIERMMKFFGERSEIEDIKNFGEVFAVSYKAGGNLKDVVRKTNEIISEKIEINSEIETALSSNTMQFKIIMVIPVVIILMMRFMSTSFAKSFATPVGIFSVTISIGIFFSAYKIGIKIMDVKG